MPGHLTIICETALTRVNVRNFRIKKVSFREYLTVLLLTVRLCTLLISKWNFYFSGEPQEGVNF